MMKAAPVWLQSTFLALPLAGYLAAIGLAEARRAGAPRYELAIEGFDPRDLVRGHYLLYRFVSSPAVQPSAAATDPSASPNDPSLPAPVVPPSVEWNHLACVTRAEGGRRSILTFAPDAPRPTTCETELPLDFVQAPHRFYVQEDKGAELEPLVRDGRASVVIVLPAGAAPSATELLIDGKPARHVKPKD